MGARLLAGDYLSDDWQVPLSRIIPLLVRGTRFEEQWAINELPVPNTLSVYILRGDLGARAVELPVSASPALNNCAASSEKDVVLCDASFLGSFLDETGLGAWLGRTPATAERRRSAEESLLLWILGHELGHVHFSDAAAHFKAHTLSSYVETATLRHFRELRADSFFVAQVAKDSERALGVTQLVIDLINVEIQNKIGAVPSGVGILYDYNDKKVVTYAQSGTHPEFVVRGARMLELVAKLPNSDLSGIGAMIRPFIQHMRGVK